MEEKMHNKPSAFFFFINGFPATASVFSLSRFLAACVHKKYFNVYIISASYWGTFTLDIKAYISV